MAKSNLYGGEVFDASTAMKPHRKPGYVRDEWPHYGENHVGDNMRPKHVLLEADLPRRAGRAGALAAKAHNRGK